MATSNGPPASSLLVSQVVKIVNTVRYNDEVGLCTVFNAERNRYTVKIDAATIVSIKGENLVLANTMEKFKYRMQEMKLKTQQVYHDPNVRRQVRHVYMAMASKLPPYLPPERLALLLLVLTVGSIRLIGFSKSIMLFSILTLPVVVSLNDIVNNGVTDPVLLMKRFPTNWRDAIVQATGYTGLSENMAMAGLAIFVAMSVKILLTAASNPIATAPSTPVVPDLKSQLQELYKLGFQDATGGKVYGTSFTDKILEDFASSKGVATPYRGSSVKSATSPFTGDNIDWASAPLPAQKKPSIGSKMGMGFIISLTAILRTVFELGRRPGGGGGIDMQLLMANLQRLEPWRKGLLAFSLYKVVSVFL